MNRNASVLLICLFLILFSSMLATLFLNTMTQYRGAGSHNVRNLFADFSLQEGKAHAIRVLQEHAVDLDRDGADYYSGFHSKWRTEFQADLSLESYGGKWAPVWKLPEMNVPTKGLTTHYDNSSDRGFDIGMTRPLNLGRTSGSKAMGYEGGWRVDGQVMSSRHGARYYDVGTFDKDFNPTADPGKTRYKSRYAVMIFDLNGLYGINFYPERSYSTAELDEDINGDSIDGDRRSEFAYLRNRYAAALYGMKSHIEPYKLLRIGTIGTGDRINPYEAAYDYHLRGVFSQRSKPATSDDWHAAVGSTTKKHFIPTIDNRWAKVGQSFTWNSVMSSDAQLTSPKVYSLRLLQAMEGSGKEYVHGNLMYLHPGPTYSFDVNLWTTRTRFKSRKHVLRHQLYTPINEQLQRHRGDDVDCPFYFNILTTHGSVMWSVFQSISSRLAVGNGTQGRTKNVTFDLLPYTQGAPLEADDNYNNKAYTWNPNYFQTDAGGNVLTYDHDGNPATEQVPEMLDESGSSLKKEAWYERVADMSRNFYGLTGYEGKEIGPRYADANPHIVKPPYIALNSAKTAYDAYCQNDSSLTTWWPSVDVKNFTGFANEDNNGKKMVVYEDYIWDIIDALSMAVEGARIAYSGHGIPGELSKQDHWDSFKNMRDTYYGDIHAVHRRFLNNLGEDVSAVAPSSTPERPETWVAQNGLLARAATGDPEPLVPGRNNWLILDPNDPSGGTIPEQPAVERLPAHVNTAGMERLLNDVRMSFFGSSYKDAAGNTHKIAALDFNHDGFAESSYNGYNDGSIPVSGVGPRPLDFDDGNNPHYPFLAKESYYPTKPFSATGRLYMGKSHYYRVIVRSVLWDVVQDKQLTQKNMDFVYAVNPSDHAGTALLEGPLDSGNPDLSDSHIIFMQEIINNTPNSSSEIRQ